MGRKKQGAGGREAVGEIAGVRPDKEFPPPVARRGMILHCGNHSYRGFPTDFPRSEDHIDTPPSTGIN